MAARPAGRAIDKYVVSATGLIIKLYEVRTNIQMVIGVRRLAANFALTAADTSI